MPKVLFVYSGNVPSGISSIVKAQADSLLREGIFVDFYPIVGKGVIGYLRNVNRLRIFLKDKNYDITHAHYSLSAFVASLAGAKSMVVSLMGSDVNRGILTNTVIKVFKWLYSWNVILKSSDMQAKLKLKDIDIIPNGVDLGLFKSANKKKCRNVLNWSDNISHILFASNPSRPEKNFNLAQEACRIFKNEKLCLHVLDGVPHIEIPYWLNASDVVILTSFWEGSPNVIKEAMACNRPIVSTNVGDVDWLFGETSGYFISEFDPRIFSEKIQLALEFSHNNGETTGRSRIQKLGLDWKTTAIRIINLYNRKISQR